MKATPRITASEVAKARTLRAQRLLSEREPPVTAP